MKIDIKNHSTRVSKAIIYLGKNMKSVIYDIDILKKSHITKSNSPMQLNDIGSQILKDSKISDFTDKYFDEIVKNVKKIKPKNEYQAQQAIIDVVKKYSLNVEYQSLLEEGAFESGSDIETILFVAAINIRDKIINMLDFKKEDIDKHAPKAPNS